ncbi:MAG: hypothetical protein JWO93_2317 [Micrococcaceae bacterium]|nr:hypothetical protein [Micrococcaceae bacterium]
MEREGDRPARRATPAAVHPGGPGSGCPLSPAGGVSFGHAAGVLAAGVEVFGQIPFVDAAESGDGKVRVGDPSLPCGVLDDGEQFGREVEADVLCDACCRHRNCGGLSSPMGLIPHSPLSSTGRGISGAEATDTAGAGAGFSTKSAGLSAGHDRRQTAGRSRADLPPGE